MSAEAVVFDGPPGHFEAARALVARTDAVGPVVIRREVAARPAQQGDVQLLGRVEHVAAEAVGVGERRAFIEDAAFDTASQVFDEVAIDFGIDIADHPFGVDLDAGAGGGRLGAKDPWRGGQDLTKTAAGKQRECFHGMAPAPQYFIRHRAMQGLRDQGVARGRGRPPHLVATSEGSASGRWPETGAEAGRASGSEAGTGRLRAGAERASGTALAALQAAAGILRAAVAARTAHVAALAVVLLGEGAVRAVFGRAAGFIAAVVGLAAGARGAVGLPFVGWDGPVAVSPEQVAHQRVLPVEHPEVAAARVVPVTILVALPDRRHVGKAGRLGNVFHFGIVLAHRLVRDGHADVFFANLVSGARNLDPSLIGSGDAVLTRGIGELGFDGADLFFVIARAAGLAVPQIHQELVPGGVKLAVERLEFLGARRQSGDVGVQGLGGAEQPGIIQTGQILRFGLAARGVARLPGFLAIGGNGA